MPMEDTTQDGRMWAAISYGSTFVGIPLGVVPLLQRDDAFAMHHAKAALGMQLAFMGVYLAGFVLSFGMFFCTFGMANLVTVPLLMLMLLWPMGTSVHGIVLAMNGDWEPALGTFGIGEQLFESITLDEDKVADKQAAKLPGDEVSEE